MIKIYRKRGVRAFDSRGKTIMLTLGRMDVYMGMYFMNIYAQQFVALTGLILRTVIFSLCERLMCTY